AGETANLKLTFGSTRASAAAAHTRTKLSESRNASVRGATASFAYVSNGGMIITAGGTAARRKLLLLRCCVAEHVHRSVQKGDRQQPARFRVKQLRADQQAKVDGAKQQFELANKHRRL